MLNLTVNCLILIAIKLRVRMFFALPSPLYISWHYNLYGEIASQA